MEEKKDNKKDVRIAVSLETATKLDLLKYKIKAATRPKVIEKLIRYYLETRLEDLYL